MVYVWLGLELIPFGQAPTSQATTPSWGEGGVRVAALNPASLGSLPKMNLFILNPNQYLLIAPLDSNKNRPYILEDRLSTIFILSALHLEGPKFKYMFSFPLNK